MKKTFITLSILVLLSIVAVTIFFWLLASPMSWYSHVQSTVPDESVAEQAEFRLVEEFHKIRPEGEIWKLRIQDKAVNAWLTHRFEDWLTHEDSMALPEGMSSPLVHTTTDGIWLGVVGRYAEGEQPVAVECQAFIGSGKLVLTPMRFRLGKLPLPLTYLESMIDEQTTVYLELNPQIELMDERIVTIQELHLEESAIILTCKTALP